MSRRVRIFLRKIGIVVLSISIFSVMLSITAYRSNIEEFVRISTIDMNSFVKGSDMTQSSILRPGEQHTGFHEFMALEDSQAELIPRIIHQIYRTSEIVRDDWREAHGTWIAMHPPSSNWTHLLWTDEIAQRFVLTEWPDFFETYTSYRYDIQRIDALRYLILYSYGGLYADLDIVCKKSVDPLLRYPAFFPVTTPLGVSNDLIGSRKEHPFLLHLIRNLKSRGWRTNYLSKYVTVLFTTGPMFVNQQLISLIARDLTVVAGNNRVLTLPASLYRQSEHSFFSHISGSSWHGADAKVVIFCHQHWLILTMMAMIFLSILRQGCLTKRCRQRYTKLKVKNEIDNKL